MEELSALFAPGMRHEQERREQLEVLRDDEGNAVDPPSLVDLDGKLAVIRLPPKLAQPPDENADDEAGVPPVQ